MSDEIYSTDKMEDYFEHQIREMLLEMSIEERMYRRTEMNVFGVDYGGVAYFAHDNGHKMEVTFSIEKDNTINGLNLSLSY